ncbi:MAG: DNA-binding protein, partial [Bacteroidales bacterium]|nr:DNA-binding protein [Bacteroidales bacterium]
MYKEDFDKFQEGRAEVIGYINHTCLSADSPSPRAGESDV